MHKKRSRYKDCLLAFQKAADQETCPWRPVFVYRWLLIKNRPSNILLKTASFVVDILCILYPNQFVQQSVRRLIFYPPKLLVDHLFFFLWLYFFLAHPLFLLLDLPEEKGGVWGYFFLLACTLLRILLVTNFYVQRDVFCSRCDFL